MPGGALEPAAEPYSEASMYRQFNRFLLFLIPSALLLAQPETATLRGSVTDSSGTPLEGIHLVIFETGKELSVREISTGTGGLYDAPFLQPGSYVVKIDADRFQTFEADGIVLIAGQVRHLDAKLKPEARDETVLVNEPPTVVQSQNGAVSGIVDFKLAWQDAPYVDLHPSVFPLLTQAPATQGNLTAGNQPGLVISGISARNQQTWSLDGIAQDTTTQTGNPAFFETVEVAIANPGIDAAKPVHVDMISKHGSDGLHGLVYYKRASSAFNAKSYFDTQKSSYKLSEVQGELGGALGPALDLLLRGRHVPENALQRDSLRRRAYDADALARFQPVSEPLDGPEREGSGHTRSAERRALSQQSNPSQPAALCPRTT